MKPTITFRIDMDVRTRLEKAANTLPYKTTLTAIIERGIQLALAEIEEMTKRDGGHNAS